MSQPQPPRLLDRIDRPQDLLILGVRVLEVGGFALQDRDDGHPKSRRKQEQEARSDQYPARTARRELR